jgi:hypothetical protein
MKRPAPLPCSEIESSSNESRVQRGMAARNLVAILVFCASPFVTMAGARAGNVQINVSDPQVTTAGNVTITINKVPYPVGVTTTMNAGAKADAIADALRAKGITVTHTGGTPSIKLPNLPATSSFSFAVGTTGEQQDSVKFTGVTIKGANLSFDNPNFNPDNANGGAAVFTGGFSTDSGDLDVSVSSSSLANTSGTTIAQALYSLLEPEASSYGVNLTLQGDDISATFDPALTMNGAGIFFGTSSTSDGVVGSISSVPEPASVGLLCAGLLGMGVILRRRQTASQAVPRDQDAGRR